MLETEARQGAQRINGWAQIDLDIVMRGWYGRRVRLIKPAKGKDDPIRAAYVNWLLGGKVGPEPLLTMRPILRAVRMRAGERVLIDGPTTTLGDRLSARSKAALAAA